MEMITVPKFGELAEGIDKALRAGHGAVFLPAEVLVSTSCEVPAAVTLFCTPKTRIRVLPGMEIVVRGQILGGGRIFEAVWDASTAITFDQAIRQDLRISMFPKDYPTQWAIAAVGSRNYTIVVDQTDSRAAVSVPSTCTFKFLEGNTISPFSEFTLTFAGKIEAGPYQITSGGLLSFDGYEGDLNPKWLGAAGDGVTNDYSAISSANTLAASAGISIRIPPGTYVINSSITFSVPVILEQGAILSPGASATLTFNAPFEANNQQIFDVSSGGSIAYGSSGVERINVKWYGAVGDGSTDDQPEINAADSDSQTSGLALYFPPGSYRMASTEGFTSPLLLFDSGAKLLPSSGIAITIYNDLYAGNHQIFDTSLGGSFELGANGVRYANVKWFGATGNGSTNDGTTVDTADAASITNGLGLYFPPGSYYFAASKTLSQPLFFESGASLKPNTGVTIAIDGAIESTEQQIFDLSSGGSIAFGGNGIREVDAKWFGATGDGTTNDATAIDTADSVAATAGVGVYFPPGSYYFSASQVLSAFLRFAPGASFKPNTGVTITINGPVEAGNYEIFDTSSGGAFVFGGNGVSELNVKWYGATGDGSTDDTAAIDACDSDANNAGIGIYLPPGSYKFNSAGYYINVPARFAPGALIQTISGGDVTLLNILAGPYQIFDTSAGGSIILSSVPGTAYDQWFDDDTPWSRSFYGTNGEAYEERTIKTELTGLSGATATWSNAIPAGAEVISVSGRVTTTITGATTFDVGDGTDVDRWGAALTLTAGDTFDLSDMTYFSRAIYGSATSIVLTANGSSFTAGAVRLVMTYRLVTAPTS